MEKNSSSLSGILYVVSTPIGNLQDITQRAVETLKKVDAILAEDTRHSGQLCKNLNIDKPFISLHAFNENTRSETIIMRLKQGESFALVSDAGTPLIADPGFSLVRTAREEGLRVIPIPGCSAVITALSASGLPCDRFSFQGFLPAKAMLRQKTLDAFRKREETIVAFESTHRIIECFEDIILVFGDNYKLILAKELTKTFETFIHDKASSILDWLKSKPEHKKGEFVLLFPIVAQEKKAQEEDLHVLKILLKELPLKQAVKLAGQLTSLSKNTLYKMALDLEQENKTK